MKVTGFSFIRNAIKYQYPVKESILSLLPLVDEYIIAVGNSDDGTRDLIASIPSGKIKIIDTVWDDTLRTGGTVLAEETNKAFNALPPDTDWAFYLQGDECLHEKDYPAIRSAMEKYLTDKRVDGLLFKWLHFYGRYDYIGTGRRWYRKEIRIIRNDKNITSWKDAQGFRFKNGAKLKVKEIDARIYHYGWVKPPEVSYKKGLAFKAMHDPAFTVTPEDDKKKFDYFLNIDRLDLFTGSHPASMQERIKKVDWEFDFDTTQKGFKNMKLKHRISHIIEDLTGYRPGEYKNYKKI
jgi:hypothetical protein